uniref:Uncharacterized protein n=1 Tax=Triticum urartu TaxID=4572 RepID=A0A8R7UZ11_TRIUA
MTEVACSQFNEPMIRRGGCSRCRTRTRPQSRGRGGCSRVGPCAWCRRGGGCPGCRHHPRRMPAAPNQMLWWHCYPPKAPNWPNPEPVDPEIYAFDFHQTRFNQWMFSPGYDRSA